MLNAKPRSLNLSSARPIAQKPWNPGCSVRKREFKTAVLFLRLGLPFTLIRLKNGALRKRSLNRKNLKTPAFYRRFRVQGRIQDFC